MEDGNSEEFDIKRGVRQGCILSPKLFKLYAEMIFKRVEHLKGINLGGENINNPRSADDTVLMAETQDDLQKIVDAVVEISDGYGLRMNVKKTKVMLIKRGTEKNCVKINGEELDQVGKFK